MTTKTPNAKHRLVAIVLFVIGSAAMTLVGIAIFKPLIDHLNDPATFQQWIADKGVWGSLAFVGLSVLQIIIAWLPGEPLELGAGYAFGFWHGTFLCMLSIAIGSTLVFLLVRHLGKRFVTLFFPIEKIEQVPILRNPKKLHLLCTIVFLIPGTPKDLLTYCIGLTPMKLSTWLLIAVFARIPSVVTSTLSGSALGQKHYWTAIIVLAITLLISLIGIIAYRRMSIEEKEGSSKPPNQ